MRSSNRRAVLTVCVVLILVTAYQWDDPNKQRNHDQYPHHDRDLDGQHLRGAVPIGRGVERYAHERNCPTRRALQRDGERIDGAILRVDEPQRELRPLRFTWSQPDAVLQCFQLHTNGDRSHTPRQFKMYRS